MGKWRIINLVALALNFGNVGKTSSSYINYLVLIIEYSLVISPLKF